MSFGKIAACLVIAGLLGVAGCRHTASESKAPATVKEQLDSQGGPAVAPATPAKPAEGEAKPDEEKKTDEGEAKPDEEKKADEESKPPADEKE